MFRRCPHGCGAEVEIDAEAVVDGDGVWARSGIAEVMVGADDRGDSVCEGGCPLTDA